jgi:hypothetical protein
MKYMMYCTAGWISALVLIVSCGLKEENAADEQIAASDGDSVVADADSVMNSISGNVTMNQISTFPSRVILTGLSGHRLVSVYKSRQKPGLGENVFSEYSSGRDYANDEQQDHFMPGIDILFGYNLLNIAHYDMKTEKGNFLFSHPVLVKTVYYPSFVPDSIDKKPVRRNYYLISVYDQDTNKDTLINKNDLRRFYHFDSTGTVKTQLIPAEYSVTRSQYDPDNDVMYVFARHDENKNGMQDDSEPVRVFWFSLQSPGKARLLY